MNKIHNYEKLGVLIGLECHQQLEGNKLFCKCQSIIKDGKPDFTIKRYLRTSASELGNIDQAALYELKKKKYFIYEGYNDINCLVELDEQPPEELNKKALEIGLQVSLLLNAKILPQIQFMRKIVIDGSNVSGFQRTALIAINGFIEISEGKIKIPTICLEEEAAKKIESTQEYTKYNISRLGITLIEIATAPDIKSPEGAKEAAAKIGMILRSVEGIKTGLGSIRQDINLSIKGHPRVEIKGFQDLRSIPKVVEFEIQRQLSSKEKISEVRKAEPDFTTSFLRPMPGSSRMYPETDMPLLKISKEMLNIIKLPELISEKIEKLEEEFNINPELARESIKNKINLELYIKQFPNLEPNFIARAVIEVPKEIKSRLNLDISELSIKKITEVLELINHNKISKSSLIEALSDIIKEGKVNFGKYKTVSDQELENEIKKIIEENKSVSFSALMGIVMSKFKGKIDGKNAAEIINKLKLL